MANLEEAVDEIVEYLTENVENERIDEITMVAGDKLGMMLWRLLQDAMQKHKFTSAHSTIVFPAMCRIAEEYYWMYTKAKGPNGFAEDAEAAVMAIIKYSADKGCLSRLMH